MTYNQKKYKGKNTGRIVTVLQESHLKVLAFDHLTQEVYEIDRKSFHKMYKELV